MTSTIIVATDIRSWVRFEVTDITPEEAAVFENTDSDEALDLARQLYAVDRLVEVDIQHDDNPDYFSEYATPAVIGYDTEGEEQ